MGQALQTIISLVAVCTIFNFFSALATSLLVIIEFKLYRKS